MASARDTCILAMPALALVLSCSPRRTAPPQALYRINVGGGRYVDPGGTVWLGEQPYRAGSWGLWHKGLCETYDTDAPIAHTDLDPLYQTIRYGQDIRLKFDNVARGAYTVRLHFADILSSDEAEPAAMRIEIEGKVVDPSFDILKATEPDRALVREFAVVVSDGQLNIDLINLSEPAQEGAKLAAVEVLRAPR